MKKLARKLRKNSEDGKFSLPVHDDDSRPLDSQGLFLLPIIYFRLHKTSNDFNFFSIFQLVHVVILLDNDLDFDVQSRKSWFVL